MKNLLSIEVKKHAGWIFNDLGYYSKPISFVGNSMLSGGGSSNLDNPNWWAGWPEGCTTGGNYDCEKGGCGYGGFLIGQQYPTTDPDPARRITVTSALGVDKTDAIVNAGHNLGFNIYVGPQTSLNPPIGGNSGEITAWYRDTTGVCTPWDAWTNLANVFEPGDVIHVPGGTTAADSWNPHHLSQGTADASLSFDITLTENLFTPMWDTSPLEVDVDDIMFAFPISTEEVGLALKIAGSSIAGGMAYILHMGEPANTAMSLVECLNKFIKKTYRKAGTRPTVDWRFTGSKTQHVNRYSVNPQYIF